jgi:Ion channel
MNFLKKNQRYLFGICSLVLLGGFVVYLTWFWTRKTVIEFELTFGMLVLLAYLGTLQIILNGLKDTRVTKFAGAADLFLERVHIPQELVAVLLLGMIHCFLVAGFAYGWYLFGGLSYVEVGEGVRKVSEASCKYGSNIGSTGSVNGWDAWYFSSTTMSTVGYGDVTPCTTGARALSSIQMLVATVNGVVFFGFLVKYGVERSKAHPFASNSINP